MPSAPLRPCASSGCRDVSDQSRCPKHRREKRAKAEQTRLTAHQRGYDRRWREFRKVWLNKRPFCGDRLDGPSSEHSLCAAEGRFTAATVVDHIVPHSGPGDPMFYDERNLQSLCAVPCHNRKTATEDGGFLRRIPGERFVITGPSGCGKTTWVHERARPGDIVFDLRPHCTGRDEHPTVPAATGCDESAPGDARRAADVAGDGHGAGTHLRDCHGCPGSTGDCSTHQRASCATAGSQPQQRFSHRIGGSQHWGDGSVCALPPLFEHKGFFISFWVGFSKGSGFHGAVSNGTRGRTGRSRA